MRITIVGQGNVATSLHAAFLKSGVRTDMVSSREGVELLPVADVFIYAVRDEALASVVAKVHAPAALHLHTSGTMPLTLFGSDKPHAGVMYFFQSFSKAQPIDDFSAVPVFIEGRNIDDVSAIYTLAQTLTSRIYETDQHDRERLHVAGVFANNFANEMYAIAAELLRDTHIPFAALLPLIDQTAAKVHTLSPRDAQTGPARRGDVAVMQHHLTLLDTLHPQGNTTNATNNTNTTNPTNPTNNTNDNTNNTPTNNTTDYKTLYQLLSKLIAKQYYIN